ncbi:MAG: glycogen debranching protein, partial [Desulfovibrio sp.]|nr:glycogen debranching protein [Desulfovibrio sp.]
MRFTYDKAACQNARRALRKEWLLTNGLGDYSSSSILYCNTRKYHGLLVAASPNGREVLLSAMEESIAGGGREFFISARQHPGQLYPMGYQYQEKFDLDAWPQFTYRVGDVRIKREMILLQGETRLLFHWNVKGPADNEGQKAPQLTLRLKPLLAYRGFHQLTHANGAIRPTTVSAPGGFGISPYEGMPPLYFQIGSAHTFVPRPDWYHNIEYFQEQERGFEFSEDLFQPGVLDIPLPPLPEGGDVYMAVGTEELPTAGDELARLWQEATSLRTDLRKETPGFIGHLARRGQDFCVVDTNGTPKIIAGYHWFDAWGRDTLIALPGLAFYGGRTQFGLDVLKAAADSMKDGLVPNMFGDSGNHAYNSADASLWYAFAVQCYLKENPDGYEWVRANAWPALKEIVAGYRKGPGMGIFVDEYGLLHAGDFNTQLTWMDASVDGKPVTPRNGCPVELTALWYNTQGFVDQLAKKFGEPKWECYDDLLKLRRAFFEHFWVAREGGYLGDVWRDGMLDQSIRPN